MNTASVRNNSCPELKRHVKKNKKISMYNKMLSHVFYFTCIHTQLN